MEHKYKSNQEKSHCIGIRVVSRSEGVYLHALVTRYRAYLGLSKSHLSVDNVDNDKKDNINMKYGHKDNSDSCLKR